MLFVGKEWKNAMKNSVKPGYFTLYWRQGWRAPAETLCRGRYRGEEPSSVHNGTEIKKEAQYVSCISGGKADNDLYVCLSGEQHPAQGVPGAALPEYDKGSGQYGFHKEQAAEAVQDKICQLLPAGQRRG